MQRHGGQAWGLILAVIAVSVLVPVLVGTVYLAPHGTKHGYFEANFAPTQPWGLGAGPLQLDWDGPRGTGGTRIVGRFLHVGPLLVEHWDE